MAVRSRRKKRASGHGHEEDVVCAFCGGRGLDPFGLLSRLARCQVCGGTGRVKLAPPIAECAYCRGSGIYPGLRMNCTSCGGVGKIEAADAGPCELCGGEGRAAFGKDYPWRDSDFSCPLCGGGGVKTHV